MKLSSEIARMFDEFAEYYRERAAETQPKVRTRGDKDLETEDTKKAWLQLWAGRYGKKGRVR